MDCSCFNARDATFILPPLQSIAPEQDVSQACVPAIFLQLFIADAKNLNILYVKVCHVMEFIFVPIEQQIPVNLRLCLF